MPITFAEPRYLLLLLAIPLVFWMARSSLAGLDTVRRRLSLGLRAALLAALALALAELEWRDELDRVEVIFLLDRSNSIPQSLQARELEVVNAAAKKLDPRRDRAKIVAFAKDAYPEATLSKDEPLTSIHSIIEPTNTDLENALRVALDTFEPGFRKRIVLVSDGNETIGDAKSAASRARAAKARIDSVPLDYEYTDEILIEKLVLPTETKVGEPIRVRVIVHAFKKTRAKVDLQQDRGFLDSKLVELEPGPNVIEFAHVVKKPGFFGITATIAPENPKDDRLSDNNTAHGYVFAKGETSVLYVHRDGEENASRPLLDALTVERVKFTSIAASRFPSQPAELQRYDAVVLDDVPREVFSTAQEEAIEFAVHDQALGLVMIGGEHSFGAGDWGSDPPSPVAKALPVEMEIKQEEIIPNGALVIVQHSCEFPDGNRWAIQVTQACIDGLSSKDYVGLLVFGMTGTDWVFKLQKADNKGRLKALAGRMEVGDMPDFNAVFEKALAALKPAPAAVKHMILLSDGDPQAPVPELIKALKQEKITLSTVAVFPHGGPAGNEVQLMKRLANELGGKSYLIVTPEDAKRLPKIFTKETQRVTRSLIVDKTFNCQRGVSSEVLRGVDKMPPLHGCVLTEPRALADVALKGPEGAPVLAHWYYGAGKALAFTSDATSRWSADWVRWPGFNNFWAQAIRWVSKDVQDSPFQVTTKIQGDRGKVILDAITEEGEFVEGLQVGAAVKAPVSGKREDVALKQIGPGRYEGEFSTKEVGTYTVSLLTQDKQGRRKHSITTGAVAPPSLEYQKLKTDRALLTEIARLGDGKLIEPAEITTGKRDVFARDRRETDVALVPQWPLALAIAVALLLLDVAVRRVAIDWDKAWETVRAKLARRKAAPRPVETMSRLIAKKQEVREEALVKFEAPPIPTGAATTVTIAGKETLRTEPSPPPSAAALPAAPGAGAPGGAPPVYTNRLLEAKRRAQREIQEKAEEPPKEGK